MKKLILSYHEARNLIVLKFEQSKAIELLLKYHYPDFKWSEELLYWTLPYKKGMQSELFQLLKGKIYVDYSRLYNINPPNTEEARKEKVDKNELLTEEQKVKIEKYIYYLRSRRYSENTINTYTEAIRVFLKFFPEKSTSAITNDDLIRFNNEYIFKNKLSSSFQNQVINAAKLFFRETSGITLDPNLIKRPKREKLLPNVLNKDEVKKILEALINQKHRTMLSLTYACGLRCGEVLHLKPQDIDSARGLIHIHQGKGKKDRIVPISEKTLIILREYYKLYKPKQWLFEGQTPGEPYSERSFQSVLKQAVKKAGINKPVSLHWLRHSYATHLLEAGTDLRYIQEILGHSSSRTTEIYTHVSTKSIQKIKSPFDDL